VVEAPAIKRKPPTTEEDVRHILIQEVLEATARGNEATRQFEEIMGQFPSGLPYPDGVQRVKNASNALTVARKEMATARNRLSDYLGRGIVPDDLKRNG
jgi:hypothetical protein